MATLMSQACERCWKRKQKCARDFPCLQCRKASVTCVRRRLGSAIDPTEAVAESYIEALKERIRVLQLHVKEKERDTEDYQVATPSSRIGQPDATSEFTNSGGPRNELHDAMQEASYLSLSAMAERTDKHRSTMEGLSFMTLFYAASAVSGNDPTTSSGSTQVAGRAATDVRTFALSDSLITRDDTNGPFRTYLDFLRQSYPYMVDNELQKCFETVMAAHERGTVNHTVAENPEMVVLVFTGIATGILLSPHHTANESVALNLFGRGTSLLSHVFDQANDLAMVQCLMALTIYSMFTTNGGSTWHLLGLAMTRCIASGMHTSRVSDIASDDDSKRRNAQTLWSLFVLDTHVSAALDRPFCLSYLDIMVSLPSSPTANSDIGALNELVQHAQLVRAFRRDTTSNLLCSFINLRHWHEIHSARMTFSHINASQLLTRGYVELIKCPSMRDNPDQNIILHDANMSFATHLDLVEEFLFSHVSAPASLDTIHIFTIGVMICCLTHNEDPARMSMIHQAINILTLLSTRYGSARGLRDLLMECFMNSTKSDGSGIRLRELIVKAQTYVPDRLQAIMLGTTLS